MGSDSTDIKKEQIHSYDLNIIHSIVQLCIITHLPIKHKKLKMVKIFILCPPRDKRYKSVRTLDGLAKQVTHILGSGTFIPCSSKFQVSQKLLASISLLLGDHL